MQHESDVMVLGAGIVGLGVALKMQEKGRSVTLVDRAEPGSGTSYGNAGIIERSSLLPYAFPRDIKELIGYALNGRKDAHYHLSALFGAAPWLFRYWWNSAPSRYQFTVKAALPLIENCLSEHNPLIEAAGAGNLIRRTGWIKAFRSAEKADAAIKDAEFIKARGLQVDFLDASALHRLEPFLASDLRGAVHYRDPANVADPQSLSSAYLALFQKRGGVFIKGDARTLSQDGALWRVQTDEGPATAPTAVVALGPWAQEFAASLGYKLSMGVKRGYHRHYTPKDGAILNHTVYDADNSYVIAPMLKGIRLTSGAEFAKRDAPPTPVQLKRIEPEAKRFFPLGEPVEAEPWMGSRPCTGDMLPIIGKAPRHKGLYFSFGHAHHGLTLAAVTGRLIAEMIAGEEPFTDPTPYRVDRF
jgi:D-amino-acid dehydrogenase